MSEPISQVRKETPRERDLFQASNSASLALHDIKEMARHLLNMGDLDKYGVPEWYEAAVSMISERAENAHKEIAEVL